MLRHDFELLDGLPSEGLEPEQLGEAAATSRNTVYRTVIDLEQRFSHIDGNPVTRSRLEAAGCEVVTAGAFRRLSFQSQIAD